MFIDPGTTSWPAPFEGAEGRLDSLPLESHSAPSNGAERDNGRVL